MDHVSRGRHRRRRRGWVSHVRWMLGALLAVIVGVKYSPPASRPRPAGKRKSAAGRAPTRTPVVPPENPEWMRRYDVARREHSDRVRQLYTDTAASGRSPGSGWCVDDQGGRGVRPYLVAHERRKRARHHASGVSPASWRDGPSPGTSTGAMGAAEAPGEWGELATLVRRWHTLQQPVA